MMMFPKIGLVAVTAASVVNIRTCTYATSVDLNVVVACVKPESLKVWTCGKSRTYPSVSVMTIESVVLKRTALAEKSRMPNVDFAKSYCGGGAGPLQMVAPRFWPLGASRLYRLNYDLSPP